MVMTNRIKSWILVAEMSFLHRLIGLIVKEWATPSSKMKSKLSSCSFTLSQLMWFGHLSGRPFGQHPWYLEHVLGDPEERPELTEGITYCIVSGLERPQDPAGAGESDWKLLMIETRLKVLLKAFDDSSKFYQNAQHFKAFKLKQHIVILISIL